MTFTPQHPRLEPAAENFSESVLLTAIAGDARSGVFARLCRYPDAGVAWVWVHLVADGRSWTFVDDDAPCGPDHLDLDGDGIIYDARPPADAVWRRSGPRHAPTDASLELSLVGPLVAQVQVSFTPGHASGASLPGRTEVLGRSTVRATIDGRPIDFDGVGQWHEQEQSTPRFLVPFTYLSLAGDDLAILGVIGPRASGGFVRGEGADAVLRRISVEPGANGFAIEVETDGGDTMRGEAEIGHAYTLPVYGRPWTGTFVTAAVAGRRLTGFVNRWDPNAQGDPS